MTEFSHTAAASERQIAAERSELQAEMRAVRSSLVRELKFLCIGAVILAVSICWNTLNETRWNAVVLNLILPGAGLVYVLFRVVEAWRQLRFSRRALSFFDRILSDYEGGSVAGAQ